MPANDNGSDWSLMSANGKKVAEVTAGLSHVWGDARERLGITWSRLVGTFAGYAFGCAYVNGTTRDQLHRFVDVWWERTDSDVTMRRLREETSRLG